MRAPWGPSLEAVSLSLPKCDSGSFHRLSVGPLVGLLGYIPCTYAMANKRPMVWLHSDPDPVEGVIIPPPPPPPARGRNALASGSGLASGCHAPARESDLVGWLNQAPGSSQYAPVRDVRVSDARHNADQMETTAGRDVVPWQFNDVPPRLVPGLLRNICRGHQEVDQYC